MLGANYLITGGTSSGSAGHYTFARTEEATNQYAQITFQTTKKIKRIVINKRTDNQAYSDKIYGCFLSISVDGATKYNRVISIADRPDAANLNRLEFSFTDATIKLSNKASEYINLNSILVYDGADNEVSAFGKPSMSSVYQDRLDLGPENIISKRTEPIGNGQMAHTKDGVSEWMQIDFPYIRTVSRVIINNRNDDWGRRIVGCTLQITVGGADVEIHVFTQAEYDVSYHSGNRHKTLTVNVGED